MFRKSQQYFRNSKETSHTPYGKGCEFESDLSFSNEEQKAVRDYPTELKFSLVAFCVSLIIVCSKLIIINRALLQKFIVYGKTYWATSSFGAYKLLSDDTKSKVSEVLLTSNNVVGDILAHFSWLLFPVLAGLGMTVLTWCMIYVDSYIPGIKPPTPFSPAKNRKQCSPRFHLGYIVAVINGLLVFLLMVLSWK
ncbi:uncharacterized protein LOC111873904 [Cryptotermes secundus]|uniref:uncharacterized protein LOC111873904 n=1 Tax=Cryptotermes secundus TaxID=105785 RepID=UPI000CD7D3E5|nr:uncharacterized protein LOC111873904 [Cryptotermes secundus]